MKIFSLILSTCIFYSISISQAGFDFNGYIVNVPAYLKLNELLASAQRVKQECVIDITRLLLRPTLNLSESGYFALEYEASATYQSETYSSIVPTSVNRRQLFDLNWDIKKEKRWYIQHGIDRFYYRQQVGIVDVSFGRQRIAWGSGRIWNPSDLFNPLNPTTFSKIEKDGVDVASLKLNFGTLSDIMFVYNPQYSNSSNYALRIRTNRNEFDIAGLAGYFDRRVIVGGDVAGNLFEAGIRTELILSMKKEDLSNNFIKAIFGVDYQWTADLYTLIEYHYNGEGEKNPTKYDLLKLMNGEVLNVGIDYLAFNISYLVHPLVTTSVTIIGNLDDGSGYIALSIVYIPTDETSITFGGQLFTGERMDEYWYYPSSCFTKIELYF